MTIGFAATYLGKNHAAFLLAADSRFSIPLGLPSPLTADIAIKTYSLGHNVGAVAAGSALTVGSAAELARGIAEDHNRLSPAKPINFYSTVRLFAYFLDRVEHAMYWSKGSEVVLAGFLTNGCPALAKVITKQGKRTEVHCYAPKQQGSLVALVGQQTAKEQIASAAWKSFSEGAANWTERAVAAIWHLIGDEAVTAIGGAPSVGICSANESLVWPFVVINGRTYLRGFDVTESVPHPTGDSVINLQYDNTWYSASSLSSGKPEILKDEGFFSLSRYVDNWVPSSEIFDWKLDNDALTAGPDLNLPSVVVMLLRPGEVSWLPEVATD